MSDISINGVWPELQGLLLSELICTEMYYHGELVELANVIYIRAGEVWRRLYFDFNIIFWREDAGAPESYEMSELNCDLKAVDVALKFNLKNEIIEGVSALEIHNGVEVQFVFTSKKRIIFSSINDVSSYRT